MNGINKYTEDYIEEDYIEEDYVEEDYVEEDYVEEDYVEEDYIEDEYAEEDYLKDDFNDSIEYYRKRSVENEIKIKDNSYYEFGEYLVITIFVSLVGMLSYRTVLFHCLEGLSYTESKMILWAMVGVSVVMSSFIVNKYNMTSLSCLATATLPYGIYTVIAYKNLLRTKIMLFVIVATVLVILYSILVLFRRIKKRKNRKNIIFNRLYKCVVATETIFTISFAIMLMSMGIPGVFGHNMLYSSVKAVGNDAEETIAKNMDKILLLQEDEWKKLSVQEKIDIMQIVANIEANFLGINHELNVGASNMEEEQNGYYDDKQHSISISIKNIESSTAKKVLRTCCHEVYHAYQHRIVDAYREVGENSKSLLLFDKAGKYAREFEKYDNGDEDFISYYIQSCEMDARKYSDEAVVDYYKRIEKYLKEQDAMNETKD